MKKLIVTFIIVSSLTTIIRSANISDTETTIIEYLYKHSYRFGNVQILKEPLECLYSIRSKKEEHSYFESYYEQNEEIQNTQLERLNKMLEDWKQKIEQQDTNTRNKILVIGDSGVGISTFVQFLAGNNSKMLSEEAGTDMYVIKDGDKIGNSLTDSFTLIPEEIKLDEDTSIIDIPGFSYSRNLPEEILVSYNIDRYYNKINIFTNRIKIVLLTEYYSVQHGIYKQNFINLLRKLYDVSRESTILQDNIALIAVKTPNTKKEIIKNSLQMIPDTNLITDIADFINQVNLFLKDKQQIANSEERNFIQTAEKIINSLLEQDKPGNFKKINIFRQPERPGVLVDMQELQNNRNSLFETVFNNTPYYNENVYNTLNRLKVSSKTFAQFKSCIQQAAETNIEKTYKKFKIAIPSQILTKKYGSDSYLSSHIDINTMNEEIKSMYDLLFHFESSY